MRSRAWSVVLVVLVAVLGCDDGAPPEPGATRIGILVRAPDRSRAETIALLLPEGVAAIRERSDPEAALAGAEDELDVALAIDGSLCGECYRLEGAGERRVIVRGGGALGAQYGVAHALEAHGVRFFHPWRTHVPAALAEIETIDAARTFEPEVARRGVHLHTIHPIEAYFSLWEPGDAQLATARRQLAWIVANRGDYVHWATLNDLEDPVVAEAWRAHTAEVLRIAHDMGLEAGLGVQLFGRSNLQLAFDLIDRDGDPAALIGGRLDILAGLELDSIGISFGEFSGVEPDLFVSMLELTYDLVQERWPGIEVTASIHVGDDPALRVTWMGEEMLYYFLATRTARPITAWIHTVMYYDLVEDAGGAYRHDDFMEHFDLLIELLREGRDVAYYPESAYWVAFDNSVPTYLPLYVRSRWLDLDAIRTRAEMEGVMPLEEHVVFSSGWEWGYWQGDVASLRASYALPPRWEDLFADMLAPWGAAGAEAAGAIEDLTRAQHLALIEQRLAAWIAGRDASFDLGDGMDIFSQPTRPRYEAIAAYDGAQRATFEADVIEPLRALGDASEAALARLRASGMPEGEPYYAELVDGFDVDVARARFAEATLRAVLAHAAGEDPSAHLEAADAALARAREAVDRRHDAMHDPDGATLIARRRPTAGLYDYGYLREAELLCFWNRERAQVRNMILGETSTVPACIL